MRNKSALKYKVSFDLALKRNPYKDSLYIVLEGTDGSGKTTQVEELTNYYRSIGRDVVAMREPRKTGLIGDIIQQILLGKKDFSPIALQYLLTTDRVLNQEEVIKPALAAGKIVISDRCFWSAIVYGVLDRMGDGYDTKVVDYLLIAHSILSFYHQFIVPDFTFYLRIPLDTSLHRIEEKRQKVKEIYEKSDLITKTIKGYDALSERFPDEITTIDGTKNVEYVTSEMVKIIGETR